MIVCGYRTMDLRHITIQHGGTFEFALGVVLGAVTTCTPCFLLNMSIRANAPVAPVVQLVASKPSDVGT